MNDFLQRLKQRKVVQWSLAYVAAAFALIQVLDIVAQQFGWPDGVRGITIALAIGFFITLVLAWYHGEKGAQRVSGVELMFLSLLLTIGGALLWHIAQSPRSATVSDSAATQATAAKIPIPDKSIAVLPFDNLSRDPDNAYFAEGIQDEILTRLASIGDLKVISRTSTKRYESKPDNLRIVANELGVANVLEGSVQKSGDAVRVNVQLIDARNDTHLWAQTFDRELKNVFAVESEVSQQIADVLKAQLSPHETHALTTAPTQNAAAYDQFLKAEYQSHKAIDSVEEADYLAADAMYQKAIVLDSGFALAQARLAYNELARHWNVRPFSEAQLAVAKESIDRAMQLAPDLPEAHLALGYYNYWGYRRYDDAVVQFQRVQQLAPSNSQALSALGFIHRRKGEWEPALASLHNALLLSPRDANNIDELGLTYSLLRRYTEAEQQLSRALAIDPEDSQAKDWLMIERLFGRGDIQGARAAFDPPPGWRIAAQINAGGDVLYLINPRVYLQLYERQFDAALREWESAPVQSADDRLVQRTARAAIQIIAKRRDAAQADCAQFKPLLDTELAQRADSVALLLQASWTNLCLGRDADAIAAARRATQVLPISRDAYFGVYQLAGLAEIETYAGAHDEALTHIEQLLEMPAGGTITIERLKHDPLWDPLRSDPRFEALLKKHTSDTVPPAAVMRVLLAAMGSRGDVQPMLALACALRARGHEVIVSAAADFAQWTGELGFPFVSSGQSLQLWLQDNWDDVNGGPRRFLRAIKRIGSEMIPTWFETTLQAAHGVDVIVSASQFAAQTVAEKLRIPLLCVAYSPTLLRSAYHAPVFMSPQRLPRWLNSALWALTDVTVWQVVRRCIDSERGKLGMPPVTSITRHLFEGMPYLLACDAVLAPSPPDWSRFDVTTTGPWFYDDPAPLDPEVDAFLDAGPPPVYVGFGSMVSSDATRLTRMLLDAGGERRLLLSAGWAGIGNSELPASVKVVNGPMPHAKLFPRVAAVVHHGGAGTTVAALRAGTPQVVVPHLADQFHNAHRLAMLGLAPAGIPIKKLNAERLHSAIGATLAMPATAREQITTRLRDSEGLECAVGLIEKSAQRRYPHVALRAAVGEHDGA